MNINQTIKIHDPALISVNIDNGFIELEKINTIEENRQKKEAEIEIIMTMMVKKSILSSKN